MTRGGVHTGPRRFARRRDVRPLHNRRPGSSGSRAADADARLQALITRVTGAFERELDRYVEAKARTEQRDVASGQRHFSLPGYPVSALASVKFDHTRAFSGSETTLAADRYYIPLNQRDEHLLFIEDVLYTGRGVLQVTWTGGMGVDTDSVIAAYPELSDAATLEVANLWQRRDTLSQVAHASGADNITYAPLKLLPETMRRLHLRKRVAYAA